MPSITLKAGREKSLLRRHPWIFSGAIQHVDGDITAARPWTCSPPTGSSSPGLPTPLPRRSGPVCGLLRRNRSTGIPPKRIRSAIQSREVWGLRRDTDSYRLIYAESDNLPGLIVDRYGDVLILQSLTAGSELWKETIADLLLEETGLTTIYERSDADVRELEGLAPQVASCVAYSAGSCDHS